MATTDWILLRLPAREGAPVTWAAADAGGQLLSVPSQEVGGALHTLSTGRRVALLVPAGDVSQFQVALPAGNEARLLQLAPFALEDQVSQDVDALHFAVGQRDALTGLVPVAVVARSRMQQWLDQATAMQLLPRAMFAESDLSPVLPGHVTLVVAEDQLLVRNDTARPLLFPAADPLLALELLLGADADLSVVNLVVHASPEDWQRHGTKIEALREHVASYRAQLSGGGLLALYAQGLAQAQPVNLMQGAFRPQQSRRTGWLPWRGAALLALALLLLHGLGSWWQLRQLRRTSLDLDQQITQLYGSIFPGQQPGSAPRRALEKRLAALAGGGPRGDLLPLLAAVSAARQNVPGAELLSLSFKPGVLQLKLAAPDASTLQQFTQALRAGGYAAEVTGGTPRGAKYEGQIELKDARS